MSSAVKKDEDPVRLNALIQILFDHGASVSDAHLTLKTTALHHAAKLCPVEVVETLIVAGADPNAQELSTHTPLTGAVLTGRADTVAALLKAGAKVDQTSRVFARTNPQIERLLPGTSKE